LTSSGEVEFGGVVARGDGVAPYQGYQRVVLKLSGEAFAGDGMLGVDPDVVVSIARQIGVVVAEGVQVAVVTGGGNTSLNSSFSPRSRRDCLYSSTAFCGW